MEPTPIVHLVDDEVELIEELSRILMNLGLAVRTYRSSLEFLGAYQRGPGCLVTDIRMPGLSGSDLVERLRSMDDTLPIIVFSGYADVATAVRVMKLGVRDVIEKGSSLQYLIDTIQRAVMDDAEVRRARAVQIATQERYALLSAREQEVLAGVTSGQTNKAIAESLGISSNTVEIHRARVMEKMGAGSLAELIRMCIQADLPLEQKKAS